MLHRPFDIYFGKASGANTTLTNGNVVTDNAEVVKGDLFLVNENMKVIAAAADVTEFIYVAQGTKTGDFKLSDKIQTRNITRIKKAPYVAPVQRVSIVGNVGAGVLTLQSDLAKTYQVDVIIKTDFRFNYNRVTKRTFSFTVTANSTDAERAAFFNQFVNAINSDKVCKEFVIATLNTTVAGGANDDLFGIRLTGLAQDYTFEEAPDYVDFELSYRDVSTGLATYEATVSNNSIAAISGASPAAPKANRGEGTYPQVSYMEWSNQVQRGNTNMGRHIRFANSSITYAEANQTYMLITIDHFLDGEGDLQSRRMYSKSTMLAIPSANTTQGDEWLNNAGASGFLYQVGVYTGHTPLDITPVAILEL